MHTYESASKTLLKQSQQYKEIINIFHGKGKKIALNF